MSFWDAFILAVSTCFQAHPAHGLPAARRLFSLAFDKDRIDPQALNDLSLLLLIVACPGGDALRQRADQVFVERNLHLPQAILHLRDLFRDAGPQRHEILLAFLHAANAEQQGQAKEILRREIRPRLQLFLSRLLLTAPVAQHEVATTLLGRALDRHSSIPSGTVDFFVYLYGAVVHEMPVSSIPSELPSPAPTWFASLSEAERSFLTACVGHLAPGERILVYLCVFARLDLVRIATLMRLQRAASEDWVLTGLERCLATVVHEMT